MTQRIPHSMTTGVAPDVGQVSQTFNVGAATASTHAERKEVVDALDVRIVALEEAPGGGLTELWTGNGLIGDTITFSQDADDFDILVFETNIAGVISTQETVDYFEHANLQLAHDLLSGPERYMYCSPVSNTSLEVKGGVDSIANNDFLHKIWGKNLNGPAPTSSVVLDLLARVVALENA